LQSKQAPFHADIFCTIMLTGAAYFAEKHMHRLEAVRAAA
jgi:hypothetical protein